MIVVVEYDRQTGMVQADTYDDADYELARNKTSEREREMLHTHPQREVVLLNGPSLEAIKKTYPKYFDVRGEPTGKRIVSKPARLYDDESVREKLTVMSKWEAMIDDARNPDEDFNERAEEFIQFGKTYRMSIEEVEP